MVPLPGSAFGEIEAERLFSPGEKKVTKELQGRSPLQALKELLGIGSDQPPLPQQALGPGQEKAHFRDWADACVRVPRRNSGIRILD